MFFSLYGGRPKIFINLKMSIGFKFSISFLGNW